MTAPSVITPRNANKLRKAKQQLSGTAKASNKSSFMVLSLASSPDLILARLVVGTTPSKKFRKLGAMSDARHTGLEASRF